MKTTFKKTLLAAAVAGFSLNAVAAVDLVEFSNSVAFSTERLADTAGTVNIPGANLTVELGAEYAVGDIIKFTFSTDAIAASQFKSTVLSSAGPAAPAAPAGNATVTLGLLSSDATSVTYRVTEVSSADSTVGQLFTIAAGANFAAKASKLTNGLKVSYAAQTSNGVAIDAGNKSSFNLVYAASEFTTKVTTPLDAIIDVADNRLTFELGAVTDQLDMSVAQELSYDPDGTGPLGLIPFTSPVSVVSTKYVVNGDFSWVKDTSDTTEGVQPVASAATITGCAGATTATTGVVFTADSMTFTCTGAPAPVSVLFNVLQGSTNGKAAAALPAGAYSLTNTINYVATNPQTLVVGPKEAGAWTLNGSLVHVPYMVVGGNRFGIIANVTNHSTKDGAITLDIFAEDGSVIAENYEAGISKAGSVTSVAGALNAALAANGISVVNPVKFSFKVTTNVPENGVIVYAAYTDNTTSERAIVNNDSKVQIK